MSENKPREWWLDQDCDGYGIWRGPELGEFENEIHVIEKSALDAVIKERDEAIFQRDQYAKDNNSKIQLMKERNEAKAEAAFWKAHGNIEKEILKRDELIAELERAMEEIVSYVGEYSQALAEDIIFHVKAFREGKV